MTNPAPASAWVVTKDFDTPGDYIWRVPVGTYSVTLRVNGAQGGGDHNAVDPTNSGDTLMTYGTGGKGARVQASFAVEPGDVLSLRVAGRGTRSAGGFGGGGGPGLTTGGGIPGYGGGGASRVLLNGVLIAMAGGGGGATARNYGTYPDAGGLDGGDSGAFGNHVKRDLTDGLRGQPGLVGSAGAAGRGAIQHGWTEHLCLLLGHDGQAGASDQGGAGGAQVHASDLRFSGGGGGGGGGGYFGGGGGGSSTACNTPWPIFSGGSGGGGSSFMSAAGVNGQVFEGVRSGPGGIAIVFDDDTPPMAAPLESPAPTSSGWHNTKVTVSWNWSDPESGISEDCPAESRVTETGIAVVHASCLNGAGISVTAARQVKVDLEGPTVSPTYGPDGVTWHWYDVHSGIDPARCPATTPWSEVVTATCYDRAGNQTTIEIPPHS